MRAEDSWRCGYFTTIFGRFGSFSYDMPAGWENSCSSRRWWAKWQVVEVAAVLQSWWFLIIVRGKENFLPPSSSWSECADTLFLNLWTDSGALTCAIVRITCSSWRAPSCDNLRGTCRLFFFAHRECLVDRSNDGNYYFLFSRTCVVVKRKKEFGGRNAWSKRCSLLRLDRSLDTLALGTGSWPDKDTW